MDSQLEQFPGNYRLVAPLGRGGFADVYLGEHIHLQTPVAIKLFRERLNDAGMQRFLEQARVLARLQHPRVARVLEVTVWQGRPALIMQYAPGGTLRQRYPAGSRLTLAKVAQYVQQAATGLSFIHSAGHIHGDVKPENMLLDEQSSLLLGDFGLEALLQDPDTIAGTAIYMAPEQAQGQASPNSDQYALAIVAYEWLCGQPPFQGTWTEVATQHALIDPPSLREQLPDIPAAVEQVILRALVKDADQRFTSTWDFASALEKAIYQPIEQPGEQPPGQLSRRTLLLGLGSTAAIGIGVGGAIWFSRTRQAAPAISQLQGTTSTTPLHQFTLVPSTPVVPPGTITSLIWSPDGTRLASTDKHLNIQLWQGQDQVNGKRGTLLKNYPAPNPVGASLLAWAPDNRRLAATARQSGTKILIWDSISGQALHIFPEYLITVSGIAWSSDGSQFANANFGYPPSGSPAPAIIIRDASTGEGLTTLFYLADESSSYGPTGIYTLPFSVAWSPDGKQLAGGTSEFIQIWQKRNDTYQRAATLVTQVSSTLAWSPDSKYIAAIGTTPSSFAPAFASREVHIWNVQQGRRVQTYAAHQTPVSTVSWSPDGKYVATTGEDSALHVWQALSGETIYTFRDQAANACAVNWSPSSTSVTIATGGSDGTLHIRNQGLL